MKYGEHSTDSNDFAIKISVAHLENVPHLLGFTAFSILPTKKYLSKHLDLIRYLKRYLSDRGGIAQSRKNWCRGTTPTLNLNHYLRNHHQRFRYYRLARRA